MEKPFDDVIVTSDIALTVEMEKRALEEDVFEYTFHFCWDMEEASRNDSKVTLTWMLPCVDVQYMWHPESRCRRVLDADWRLKIDSMLTGSAPLAMLFNAGDLNTYTFATDEVKKVTSVQFGVNDGRDAITGKISMGLRQFTGKNTTRLLVRADFRRIPYYEALDDVRNWWEQVLDIEPMAVPDVARQPMFSTWYNFHKDIAADVLLDECKEAKKLGMDTVIIDDGWHTSDGSGGEDNPAGYACTGDWEVCQDKFPDFKGFIQKLHALDMKVILWFSVPFLGYQAKNWERFKDKIIYRVDRNGAGVLDPRYPEVREFLIGTYERFLNDYDIDGFKLDFIDRFHMTADDQVTHGMDYACIQEATERLMTDAMLRLRVIKPGIMIEFRQKYIGPAMRRFGNMFRVADCPGDITTNRVGITDLRLISGDTAVHSDMITWNENETPEDAALQILNTIFGVIQVSKIITKMKPEHIRILEFWLRFAKEHEKLLLESGFAPSEPNYLYPVIRAYDAHDEIIGVYARNKIVKPCFRGTSSIINATKEPKIYIFSEKEEAIHIRTRDTLGHVTEEEDNILQKGISEFFCPRSGLLEIKKI